ncbi:Serine--tRNA ligase [Beijerinckiaceae bacterium RH AL1]|nr:Serine--tRNA ligase [Beijerinckiaceae bacterium RH AL1]
MFDPRWIRENAAAFDEGRRKRGLAPLSAELIALDDARRAAIAAAQEIQERRNAASQKIGAALKAKDQATADALKAEVAELKGKLGALEAEEAEAARRLDEALAAIPNLPADDVPEGRDEHDNVLFREWGEKPRMNFQPKEHFALGEALGLMDFETAAKISGARFVVTKGPLARLERALAQFMLDLHTGEHGYTEVNPPLLVRDEAMFGTAQLPNSARTSSWRRAKARRRAAATSGSSRPPRSRSPTSCAKRFWTRRRCRCASPRRRRASAPRLARRGATRAA